MGIRSTSGNKNHILIFPYLTWMKLETGDGGWGVMEKITCITNILSASYNSRSVAVACVVENINLHSNL